MILGGGSKKELLLCKRVFLLFCLFFLVNVNIVGITSKFSQTVSFSTSNYTSGNQLNRTVINIMESLAKEINFIKKEFVLRFFYCFTQIF